MSMTLVHEFALLFWEVYKGDPNESNLIMLTYIIREWRRGEGKNQNENSEIVANSNHQKLKIPEKRKIIIALSVNHQSICTEHHCQQESYTYQK